MASFQSIFIPATAIPTKISALAASTASSTITFAKYAILAIQATGNINVTFGNAATGITASATGWLIPAGATAEFELGSQWDSIQVFNSGSSPADVYILSLSRN